MEHHDFLVNTAKTRRNMFDLPSVCSLLHGTFIYIDEECESTLINSILLLELGLEGASRSSMR